MYHIEQLGNITVNEEGAGDYNNLYVGGVVGNQDKEGKWHMYSRTVYEYLAVEESAETKNIVKTVIDVKTKENLIGPSNEETTHKNALKGATHIGAASGNATATDTVDSSDLTVSLKLNGSVYFFDYDLPYLVGMTGTSTEYEITNTSLYVSAIPDNGFGLRVQWKGAD